MITSQFMMKFYLVKKYKRIVASVYQNNPIMNGQNAVFFFKKKKRMPAVLNCLKKNMYTTLSN